MKPTWQQRMKEEGKCTRCGKPRDCYSTTFCKTCLKKHRERALELYHRKRGGKPPKTKYQRNKEYMRGFFKAQEGKP